MKPFAIKTSLLEHQLAAVNKIKPTRVGALFMDMGTGKSLTAMELVRLRSSKIEKVVWFCPVSLKETVKAEILKHTDSWDIYIFDSKTRGQKLQEVRWYIIGIESMSMSDRQVIAANKLITDKTFVILDESSFIKGHRSLRTVRITALCQDALYRLILTGTPLSQGVIDLFAQMRFLSPKILGYHSFYGFAANHLEYSERYPGMIVRTHNIEYLAAKIQPYTYQVTKEECLSLPSKLYEGRWCSMTDEQSEFYHLAKEEILQEIEQSENFMMSSIAIFRLFSILQQISCGFWNRRIKTQDKEESFEYKLIEFKHNRMDTLYETIEQINENEKIIIWAKFQREIESITKYLNEKYGNKSAVKFYGLMSEKKRAEAVEQFKAKARFFVATQSCGGHGLTLNEASYVIFYNNGFKYSERQQAEDRCHRIGQTKKITYIDIECRCGIDERIDKALSKKRDVVREFRDEIDKVKDNKNRMKDLIKGL